MLKCLQIISNELIIKKVSVRNLYFDYLNIRIENMLHNLWVIVFIKKNYYFMLYTIILFHMNFYFIL